MLFKTVCPALKQEITISLDIKEKKVKKLLKKKRLVKAVVMNCNKFQFCCIATDNTCLIGKLFNGSSFTLSVCCGICDLALTPEEFNKEFSKTAGAMPIISIIEKKMVYCSNYKRFFPYDRQFSCFKNKELRI